MTQHSRAIACIMFALCVGSCMGAQIASIWQQCGGTSCPSGVCQDAEWKDTKCAAGLKCFRQTEFYYQCRATAQLYEQCGGISCQFKGVCADSNWAACTNGHNCVRKSEFYWQCLPANLAQVQSTKATASMQSASSAKNMRLSQAQLAHVPIPRHSVVHVSAKKPAEDAAVAVASAAAPARIRPVDEAPVHNEKQPEQIRPAAAAAVTTAAIKPAAAAATAAAAKPSAAAAAAKPAAIGMPYSTDPTKPAAAAASKAAEDAPVAIASTTSSTSSAAAAASSTAAAKPSSESKPAASRIGMPYSSEPTKPAAAATVAVASAAKPSAVASKPAGVVGMPYSADPTKPGSSSSSHPAAAAAASISTAAVSRVNPSRAEPSSAHKPASAAAARSRGGAAREQHDAAELQWERPALSTASLREEPQPAHSRPPPQMMRPQT